MSEYRYYEFQTIDRRLDQKEMQDLRGYSSRARITPTSFTNEYSFGSFKGNADAWMEKYFDAYLYLANWGTHELQVRAPARLLAADTARDYCAGTSASVREKAGNLIFTFLSNEEGGGEWGEGGGVLSSILPQTATPGPPARKRDLIMAQRTKSGEQAADILERLASEEAVAVLHLLLDKHPELRPEVEVMAKNIMSSKSIEDIAADVFSAVTGVDLEALHGRADKHSWGYVEPSEAAWELLEEALEDWVDDMKRKVEADLLTAAQAVCVGIVAGLYNARNATSDGVLDWAPNSCRNRLARGESTA